MIMLLELVNKIRIGGHKEHMGKSKGRFKMKTPDYHTAG